MLRLKVWAILLCALLSASPAISVAADRDYLSAGELGGIGAGSIGLFFVGNQLNRWDSTRASLWTRPLPGEASLQRLLGGEYYPNKTNFLDGTFGSALTPTIGGIVVGAASMGWPSGERWKDGGQDLYVYGMGLLATKGLTFTAKGIVARPRPMIVLGEDRERERADHNFRYDHQSFFSGHASSAFYAMTYANRRVRSVMRREMSVDDYRDWRWVSPLVSYGWATFVGWSRIHSYKHFTSDVLIGALAGWAMAELFYALGDSETEDASTASDAALFFRITLPID